MALTVIPTRNDLPAYNFRIDLDEVVYKLRIRHNGRMNRWVMDVSDDEDNPIICGIVLLSEVELIPFTKPSNFPQGDFFLVHETKDFENAIRETLSREVQLYYNEATA